MRYEGLKCDLQEAPGAGHGARSSNKCALPRSYKGIRFPANSELALTSDASPWHVNPHRMRQSECRIHNRHGISCGETCTCGSSRCAISVNSLPCYLPAEQEPADDDQDVGGEHHRDRHQRQVISRPALECCENSFVPRHGWLRTGLSGKLLQAKTQRPIFLLGEHLFPGHLMLLVPRHASENAA